MILAKHSLKAGELLTLGAEHVHRPLEMGSALCLPAVVNHFCGDISQVPDLEKPGASI